MSKEQLDYVVCVLREMCVNLKRSGVPQRTIASAVINTAGNLGGNCYDEIVERVIGPWDRGEEA